MATTDWGTAFAVSRTEDPLSVIPQYAAQIRGAIAELQNDLAVTQKQLQAAEAALKALEAI